MKKRLEIYKVIETEKQELLEEEKARIEEIEEYKEYIKSNELSLKDAEYMYDNLRGLVIIYEEILTKLPKDKKEQPNYEYNGKNFVCLMNDSIKYYIQKKKAELLKAITFLKN